MDTQVRWLRQWIGPRLLTRLVIEFLILANLLFLILLAAGSDRFVAAASAFVGGQLIMVVRVAGAFRTNPASHGYLRRYTAVPAWSRVVDADASTQHQLALFFENHNMAPDRAVAVTTNVGTSSADVFVSTDGFVVGVAGPDSDLPVVVSALDDGRFLITSQQVVPVYEALVVNTIHQTDARQLLERHVDGLELLHARGVSPARSGPETVATALALEHDAWAQLGPYYSPFLAVGSRWRPLHLLVHVPPEALLEMGIKSTGVPLTHTAPMPLPANAVTVTAIAGRAAEDTAVEDTAVEDTAA
jgi:hypothetical protein